MKKKKKLILFAHGSSDPKWKKPFEDITKKLQTSLGENNVSLAYLEKSTPTLMDTIKEANRSLVSHVKILPVFMSFGTHLEKDFPVLVDEIQEKFPNIKIEVLKPIGEYSKVIDIIYRIAKESYN